jgi:hypothetical protein
MALLPDVFVPEEAKSNGFEPIPLEDCGWFEAELTKSELKTTKDKKGKYLSFCFKILEGDHEGRMIWTNLNIVNKNETAVKIAQGDLKAICEGVGFEGELEDTEDLHNIPLAIKVSYKDETSQWPAKNEIKGYKSLDEVDL